MALTDEHISEIAELLDCGMLCFYHRATGTIESFPDPNQTYLDEEQWQDTIDKIENNRGDYDRFERMRSNQAFQIMQDFADSLNDDRFREEILNRLARRKPFRNFNALIDDSKYRQNWFDFKAKAYIDFVKEQAKQGDSQ